MRILQFIFCLLLFSSTVVEAQIKDEAARSLLDNLYQKYESAGSIASDFVLQITSVDEEENEIQEGKMIQQGDKNYVGLQSYEVFNDGVNLWIYLIDSDEVQWTNADSDDSDDQMPNLNDILTMYRTGEFDYAMIKDTNLPKASKKIEFTPIDKELEFFKMSMVIDSRLLEPTEFRIFQKDGTRYVVDLKNVSFGEKYPRTQFVFDSEKYPNVHIEDLRID